MIITILVPDIHSNILGAANAIADALRPQHEVEIVGPDFGHGINPMYRTGEYTVVSAAHLYRWPDYLWESMRLAKSVKGRLIIAVKAYADTIPVALWRRRQTGAKVVVYLDEWDSAVYRKKSPFAQCLGWLRHVYQPMDDAYFPLVERMISRADGVVSTSSFLQGKFGGQIIPMGVNTGTFSPHPEAERRALKTSQGLTERRVIVFGGVARPHKGVELILDGLVLMGDPAVRLLIVGPWTEYLRTLMDTSRYRPYLHYAGVKEKEEMPAYLDLADLVVIPQSDTLLGQSQVPCKVFDAMAMAKPIVATAVSDLPEILDGCGWIVAPGDVRALAGAIREVLDHPSEAAIKGQRAREKCVHEFDARVVSQHWIRLVDRLVEE